MNTTQEFIERWYPGYSSSDDIVRLNDLQVLFEEEYLEGSEAERMLNEEFGGDFSQAYPMIEEELLRTEHSILLVAIANYMESTK